MLTASMQLLSQRGEGYTAAWNGTKNLDRVTTEPSYETNATGSLTYQASSSGYTRDGLCGYTGTGGLGQKMRVYKDNVNKRFVILQNSYLGRFSGSLFPNGTYVATYIAAYQAGVRRVGLDSDVSSVTGCIGQFNQSTSNVWNLVNSIVSVVASYAGYSYIYEGLRTALGGVSGSASATWYSDYGAYMLPRIMQNASTLIIHPVGSALQSWCIRESPEHMRLLVI